MLGRLGRVAAVFLVAVCSPSGVSGGHWASRGDMACLFDRNLVYRIIQAAKEWSSVYVFCQIKASDISLEYWNVVMASETHFYCV